MSLLTPRMTLFKSILVDVDSTASVHPALERAIRIARATGASLTVVDVVTVPESTRLYRLAEIEDHVMRDRQDSLHRLAGSIREVPAVPKLLTGRPAIALIEEVLREKHDLIMRSHARAAAAPDPAFGVVDMELLRMCPCPVLLARHGRPTPKPRIAGAVNTSAEEKGEHELNVKIVEMTLAMSRLLEGQETSLVHAWTPFAELTVRRHASDDQFAAYEENARRQAEEGLARLMKSFEARAVSLRGEPLRGEAEDVIPQYVVSEGIDLLVMGTSARAGLAGMLIGNTAERILRRLPCSVLTVKPDGFKSPVVLHDG